MFYKLIFCLFLSHCVQASSVYQLFFVDNHSRYALLVENDRFGEIFLDYFNSSLTTAIQPSNPGDNFNIWDMNLIAINITLQASSFFLRDSERAKAIRYLGYWGEAPTQNSQNTVRELFDSAQRAVPASPKILASKVFYQSLYGLCLPVASFIFWQLIRISPLYNIKKSLTKRRLCCEPVD